mmetsp:Transcript_1881/g.5474  ORF Transcript_1881/g.5474 Transcript_1881/m.5474 type:complete len:462 (+) Transcript_1881:1324-2709(+)
MQQCVDVAMSVGLGQNLARVVGIERDGGIVIRQGRDALPLLDDGDLIVVQAKVGVGLEKSDGLGVGITGRHDAEGQLGSGGGVAGLVRQNRLDVVLDVLGFGGQLRREADLDVAVAQPLAQPTGHQHESAPAQQWQPLLLHGGPSIGANLKGLAAGHLRPPPLEGIFPPPALLQEQTGIGDVSRKSTGGVAPVHLLELGDEGHFPFGADGGGGIIPRGKEVGLVARWVAQGGDEVALRLGQRWEDVPQARRKAGRQIGFHLGPDLHDDKVVVRRTGQLRPDDADRLLLGRCADDGLDDPGGLRAADALHDLHASLGHDAGGLSGAVGNSELLGLVRAALAIAAVGRSWRRLRRIERSLGHRVHNLRGRLVGHLLRLLGYLRAGRLGHGHGALGHVLRGILERGGGVGRWCAAAAAGRVGDAARCLFGAREAPARGRLLLELRLGERRLGQVLRAVAARGHG